MYLLLVVFFFFFKQKTAYDMRISDWSSDVCSSDLLKVSIVMTGVGMFALAGIVIRNGILIIEFIDQQREAGISVHDAVIEGGRTRMTPVILTAMAAI